MQTSLPPHVWNIRGTPSSPTTSIIGGTHGDELLGIAVIKRLLSLFGHEYDPPGTYEDPTIHGNLFLILGNPQAIALRQRSASGVRDLNRCFHPSDLERAPSADDFADLIRARELAPLLASADVVFDLHGTSSDSPPFVCLGKDSPLHRRFYRHLPVHHILSDPKNILAQDEGLDGRGTTDEYVDRHGGMAICYETGKEDALHRTDTVLQEMLTLLQEAGTLSPMHPFAQQTARGACTEIHQEVYALEQSVQAQENTFRYAPGVETGWQNVHTGQLVGTYASGKEERISTNGMLVFPKAPGKVQAGKNLYYLAVKIAS